MLSLHIELCGNKYIMAAIALDGNCIDTEPSKSRGTKDLINTYQEIFWKGMNVICPIWHMLDNEAPQELKEVICENKCCMEHTPPDIYWWNVAKHAIQMLKGHFIAVLADVADYFPIHQWNQLVLQTVIILNLLRQTNVAPNVSAYSYHHNPFDYNRILLAHMGCAVQFHNKPNQWQTWCEHSSNGWCLQTSLEHYHCHKTFIKAAEQTRISNKVFFKHKCITQPTFTPADTIIHTYQELMKAINGITTTTESPHMESLCCNACKHL